MIAPPWVVKWGIKLKGFWSFVEDPIYKTTATFVAAALIAKLATFVCNLEQNSFAGLKDTLFHHACSTTGMYVYLGVAVSCFGLLVVSNKHVPSQVRKQIPNILEMLGHLTTAGFGFAFTLFPWTANPETYWIAGAWFIGGWICFQSSKVLDIDPEKIEDSKSIWANVLGKWVVVLLAVTGVYIVAVGPLEANKIAPKCIVNTH